MLNDAHDLALEKKEKMTGAELTHDLETMIRQCYRKKWCEYACCLVQHFEHYHSDMHTLTFTRSTNFV